MTSHPTETAPTLDDLRSLMSPTGHHAARQMLYTLSTRGTDAAMHRARRLAPVLEPGERQHFAAYLTSTGQHTLARTFAPDPSPPDSS